MPYDRLRPLGSMFIVPFRLCTRIFHHCSLLTLIFPRVQKNNVKYTSNDIQSVNHSQKYSPAIRSALCPAPIQHQYCAASVSQYFVLLKNVNTYRRRGFVVFRAFRMDAHSDCNKEYDKEPYQTNYAIGNEHAFPELSPDNHNERVDRNCLFNVVMPSQRVTNL